MKMNYRDRIIAMVFLSVVILVAGFFLLVKPQIDEIPVNKEERTRVSDEWDGIKRKIDAIPGLKDTINKSYDEAIALTKIFVPENSYPDSYMLDKEFQAIADRTNADIAGLEVSAPKTSVLSYYFNPASILTIPMTDVADINGDKALERAKDLTETAVMTARKAETVFTQQYGVKIFGNREEIWDYISEIKKLNKAIIIKSVTFDDYNYEIPYWNRGWLGDWEEGGWIKKDDAFKWKEAEREGFSKIKVPVTIDSEKHNMGYTHANILIELYSVVAMDKPNVDAE